MGDARSLDETLVATPRGRLTLAIASEPADVELGLMCVRRLPRNTGMIFVFNGDQRREFWMKNTVISLDMIWLDARGVVTSVSSSVPASKRNQSERSVARRSGFGQYVIELAAGAAARTHIATGTHLFSAR